MGSRRLPVEGLHTEITGNRSRGRQPQRWIANIKEDLLGEGSLFHYRFTAESVGENFLAFGKDMGKSRVFGFSLTLGIRLLYLLRDDLLFASFFFRSTSAKFQIQSQWFKSNQLTGGQVESP